MNRLPQLILISSTLLGSWLWMQAIHEFGHVLGAQLTGGKVERVVLHPLTISRTDLSENPHPLVVVWLGPLFGIAIPSALWGVATLLRWEGRFVLRFFAAFCLLANGLYIGIGSIHGVGDCGEMLRYGSDRWQLWLFGSITAPLGLVLWHGQGSHFGFAASQGRVDRRVTVVSAVVCAALIVVELLFGGE